MEKRHAPTAMKPDFLCPLFFAQDFACGFPLG
jgi:hypothetical protein